MSRKYNVDDYFFDEINTEEKAYVLGLLYTDGSNYIDMHKIKFDCAEDSKDIIYKMKDCIKYEGDIKRYDAQVKNIQGTEILCQPSYRLLISSMQLSQRLKEIGMDKSKKYRKYPRDLFTSEEIEKHFIRGLIDGDGSITYWIDNENTGHKKFAILLCTASDIIQYLSEYLGKKFNCCPSIQDRLPDSDNDNLQFTISGNQVCRRVLDWLYDGATIYIERKYDKYLELIEENERCANDKTLYGSMNPRRKVINLNTKEIFESLAEAGRAIGKRSCYIFSRCKKKTDYMYYDEYLQLNAI